jgi:hypothetical protein
MPNYAPVKHGNDFEKCPEGTYQFVVSNFYNIGKQMRKDGNIKHQCIILFEINKLMTQGQYAGKRFIIFSYYNYTMSKKAQLRIDIEAISKNMSDDEAAQFDLDSIRGMNGQGKVIYDGEFVNLKNISGLMEGIPLMQPELPIDYIPESIKKKIDKQIIETAEMQHNELSKVDMFNSIQINLKKHPEKRNDFQTAWIKAGGTLDKVSDETMTQLYWDFGVN